jgi:hypothetical protein
MLLFKDREDAAKQLVRRLEKEWLDKEYNTKDKQQQQKSNNNNDIIVLAIPRGGVVIGDVISNILDAKLYHSLKKNRCTRQSGTCKIGAVMPDGSYFLNEDIANMLNVPQSYIISDYVVLYRLLYSVVYLHNYLLIGAGDSRYTQRNLSLHCVNGVIASFIFIVDINNIKINFRLFFFPCGAAFKIKLSYSCNQIIYIEKVTICCLMILITGVRYRSCCY